MKEELEIEKRFSNEICAIENILKDLEEGNYYEKTGVRMDGYLSTNIQNLRKKFYYLLTRIEADLSVTEELAIRLKSQKED